MLSNYIISALFVLSLPWFSSPDDYDNVKVVLHQEQSSITIEGTTNVHDFSCRYCTDLPQDTFKLQLRLVEENKISTAGAQFKLPVRNFRCDNSQMTKEFKSLLKHEQWPFIRIELLSIFQNGKEADYVMAAIKIAGIEQQVNVKVSTDKKGKTQYVCTGESDICISDFNLEAPEKFFGMVKVNDMIAVKFNLVFTIL